MPEEGEEKMKREDIEELRKRFAALKAETAQITSSAIENIEEKARQAKDKLLKAK